MVYFIIYNNLVSLMISRLRPWFPSLFRNFNFRNISLKSDEHSRIPISVETLNPYVKNVEYAVRGPIPSRALEIESELISGSTLWPFEKLIYTNIGDPQNLGQLPLTFPRQLLALCSYPALISDSNLTFPKDVKNHAQFILDRIGSFGGYTHSLGLSFIRDNVENFLSKRDGYKSTSSTIILSDGASKIISVILSCLNNVYDSPSGVMIPIPQYPLYSACLSYYGLIPIPYFLDEDSHWGLNLDELRKSILRVKGKCVPRALVVINPGNPTGQCLNSNQQDEIIEFSIKNNLLLLADEVYQDNVYDSTVQWSSFRKCFLKNQSSFNGHQQVSFHSLSKGFMGECGYRGGFAELIGFDNQTIFHLTKLLSSMLCPNIAGQLLLDTYVNPPVVSEPSYQLYCDEKNNIIKSLKRRAERLYNSFRFMNNISLNPVQGAMYAFPRIYLPKGAIDASVNNDNPLLRSPDVFYCMKLLENTGIVVVPGSGFGQKDGTFHFRITILPQEKDFDNFLLKFQKFNEEFMKKFS